MLVCTLVIYIKAINLVNSVERTEFLCSTVPSLKLQMKTFLYSDLIRSGSQPVVELDQSFLRPFRVGEDGDTFLRIKKESIRERERRVFL